MNSWQDCFELNSFEAFFTHAGKQSLKLLAYVGEGDFRVPPNQELRVEESVQWSSFQKSWELRSHNLTCWHFRVTLKKLWTDSISLFPKELRVVRAKKIWFGGTLVHAEGKIRSVSCDNKKYVHKAKAKLDRDPVGQKMHFVLQAIICAPLQCAPWSVLKCSFKVQLWNYEAWGGFWAQFNRKKMAWVLVWKITWVLAWDSLH